MHRLTSKPASALLESPSPAKTFDPGVATSCGTLMWVGSRFSYETSEPYRYCESKVAQIAYRPTIEDALARPASAVSQILIYRERWQVQVDTLAAQLAAAYPQARVSEMFGSLWEGQRREPGSAAGYPRFYWYRWNQVLPTWISNGLSNPDPMSRPIGLPHCSVAIMAGTFAAADPLMEIATSAGAAAVWCRGNSGLTARNVTVVWWDDSVAKEAPAQIWRARIAAVAQHARVRPHQIWLTRAPRVHDYRQARGAGVDMILSKPYQIDVLTSTLQGRCIERSAQTKEPQCLRMTDATSGRFKSAA